MGLGVQLAYVGHARIFTPFQILQLEIHRVFLSGRVAGSDGRRTTIGRGNSSNVVGGVVGRGKQVGIFSLVSRMGFSRGMLNGEHCGWVVN